MTASSVIEKQAQISKPQSEAVKDMGKISTYNGDTTDKYSWS